MGNSNAGLKSVYDDRAVPLKQIKVVADMYAVNVVDTAHKVRDGALTPAQGLQSVADARKAIDTNWKAYLATQLVPDVNAFPGHIACSSLSKSGVKKVSFGSFFIDIVFRECF